MEFRIADTFTDSLAKLTAEEQKAVKTTAFDLQLNPANPGMQFHRLDRARDRNFWSVRVSRDLRLIVHRTDANLLLCYVGHHDNAYAWAERRKIERHPTTGAAQLVEIRETVQEVVVPVYVTEEAPAPPQPRLFADLDRDELLQYGVPKEWVEDVLAATEDSLLAIVEYLPHEAAEALLDLATGTKPRLPEPAPAEADPFEHPDARRRFRLVADNEELERALEAPWEKWSVFLHPDQRGLVERDFNGPARVSGSAGTGKTVVAVHRAVALARKFPKARVLLTTFNELLAKHLAAKIDRLCGNEPRFRARIVVDSLDALVRRLGDEAFGGVRLTDAEGIARRLDAASRETDSTLSRRFLATEWSDVVDAWQIRDWPSYRDVKRLGRKRRLGEKQRRHAWDVFERVLGGLDEEDLVTLPGLYGRVSAWMLASPWPPFDFVVVDEAQDVSVPQLRLLAQLGKKRPESLFFAGDLGQRIFQAPFSWKSLGVDVRGRSHTLRVNYRTSHQIRRRADVLLPSSLQDVDGNEESRTGTVSVFSGPEPTIRVFASIDEETKAVAGWLKEVSEEGVGPDQVGLIVRSETQVPRAGEAADRAGLPAAALEDESDEARIAICRMHQAKGLEFRAVAVMACDDEVIPLQDRIESIADEADLEEVYNTERHLLYVACTRARDHLLVTGVDPASEFLGDLE